MMAVLGLGAGVALGEVTGADRLVHAASPSGPDPVFSGTGIQFPSLTSDPSQLVGNMWYRSDLTAMKYSDGTNSHELAALDLALTWTGVQTFNGGIVFDAAGSIAGTSTFIEADGVAGDLVLNAGGTNRIYLGLGGTTYYRFDSGNFIPVTDSSVGIGYPSFRFAQAIANVHSVYHAAGASFPTAQLADGVLNLGTGTAATDTQINRAAAGVVGLPGIKTAAGGTTPTTVTLTSGTAYTASTTQNMIVTIGGGTVTAIAINGTTTGLISGVFYLKANDTITVTFTTAPTALQMVA
jgi:hypothetical protein